MADAAKPCIGTWSEVLNILRLTIWNLSGVDKGMAGTGGDGDNLILCRINRFLVRRYSSNCALKAALHLRLSVPITVPKVKRCLEKLDKASRSCAALAQATYLQAGRLPSQRARLSRTSMLFVTLQEKMCRLSGMAQKITPELLQLRQRDQDMHKVLKVALQPWPTLAGKDALVDFGVYRRTRESYFSVDRFCKDKHEDIAHRHKLRKTAVDSADQAGGGSVAPIVIMDRFFYDLRKPRTIADLDYGLVAGSSSMFQEPQ